MSDIAKRMTKLEKRVKKINIKKVNVYPIWHTIEYYILNRKKANIF